jgi:hypothetical protein
MEPRILFGLGTTNDDDAFQRRDACMMAGRLPTRPKTEKTYT